MRIGLFSLPEIAPGKQNIKDERLDQVDKITKSKKKVYIQVELLEEEDIRAFDGPTLAVLA